MKPAVYIIVVTVVLMTAAGHCPAGETVRLTNGEWAPYLSQNLPHHGFASHIVTAAFNAVNIEVKYRFFPWKRSYKLAREGEYNGTLVWVYTPERAKSFYYSEPVVIDHEYLFHLKSRPLDWQRVEDLNGLRIGGTLHTVYPVFEEAQKKGLLAIERSGTYENLYQRLLKRRIDAIPQVSEVGAFLIRTTLTTAEQSQITHSPTIIETRRYALILSKKVEQNKIYLEKFNQGLAIIHQNGLYQRLKTDLNDGKYDP